MPNGIFFHFLFERMNQLFLSGTGKAKKGWASQLLLEQAAQAAAHYFSGSWIPGITICSSIMTATASFLKIKDNPIHVHWPKNLEPAEGFEPPTC